MDGGGGCSGPAAAEDGGAAAVVAALDGPVVVEHDEALLRYCSSKTGVPVEELECVAIPSAGALLFMLQHDRPSEESFVAGLAHRNEELQAKLDLATEALQSLTEKIEEDHTLLVQERQRADLLQRKCEQLTLEIAALKHTDVVEIAAPLLKSRMDVLSPTQVGEGTVAQCRASNCTCTNFVPQVSTTWLCICGHTSIKHQVINRRASRWSASFAQYTC
eukprot:TRINITY_DN2894_c0_g1_i4.p2 TRINITY_DN2894_c0_g1~~TRINITY_DN2894_c0_g1_i4.p2  ORF type:complete len:219 (+),score=73.90 TRINITY_DN2894_c0_g1_i4:73-729(+)